MTKLPTNHSPKRAPDHEANPAGPGVPRHRAIYEELLKEIESGVYGPGDRLPSEALLCERFDASRITVAKAVQGLQRDRLVTRRPGSGTYVESPARPNSLQFGLLIPDLGATEIFGQICQGIMRSPAAKLHSLTWGHSTGDEGDPMRAMEGLCQQYISQRVAGVFFAPSEHATGKDEANRRIVSMLERAGIPIVLLDRCFEPYPDRSNFDLVGIDNHRAGYVLTRHLLQTGAQRIVFAMRNNSASTVGARAAGYREALYSLQGGARGTIVMGDFEDSSFVEEMVSKEKPDAIVCANDVTAARLMQTLVSLGVRIPGDIKMVGVDDVRYAKFLPTQLTSIRQNCIEMGAVAMATMLERVESPGLPVKDVLVRFELIVRASSGGER
ncbi:MAG: GntR family transcriptional regulator [Acidobacteriaceae bacterium]|jgi:GntR family transcriptional regulator of arabinose operon